MILPQCQEKERERTEVSRKTAIECEKIAKVALMSVNALGICWPQ